MSNARLAYRANIAVKRDYRQVARSSKISINYKNKQVFMYASHLPTNYNNNLGVALSIHDENG